MCSTPSGVFMLGGFKGQQLIVTKEAVEAQRADHVKRHQDIIENLEKKVMAAKARLEGVEAEIEKAYKQRQERFEVEERAISLQRRQADGHEIRLNQDIEAFKSEKSTWQAQNAKDRASIEALIDKNEAVLSGIQAHRLEMEVSTRRVDDYGVRLAIKDDEIKAREARLQSAQNFYEKQMGEVKALENRVAQQRTELKIESDTMAVQRATFEENRRSLEALKKSSDEAVFGAREELASLVEEKENLLAVQRKNAEQISDIKKGLEKVADENGRLKAWERTLSIKEGELSTREKNVKALEQKGG